MENGKGNIDITKVASVFAIAAVIASFVTWAIQSLDTKIILAAAIWILIFEIGIGIFVFLDFSHRINNMESLFNEDIDDLRYLIGFFTELSGKFLSFYERIVDICIKKDSNLEKCPPEIIEEYKTLKIRLEEFDKKIAESSVVAKSRSHQYEKFRKK